MRALHWCFAVAGLTLIGAIAGWAGLDGGPYAQSQSTPPEITFIDFPRQVEVGPSDIRRCPQREPSEGEQFTSDLIGFHDPNGGEITHACA